MHTVLQGSFGEISPKIRTSNVRIPVDTPMYLLPNMFVQKVVASAEAEMLTMLFPTRIALNNLLEFRLLLILSLLSCFRHLRENEALDGLPLSVQSLRKRKKRKVPVKSEL